MFERNTLILTMLMAVSIALAAGGCATEEPTSGSAQVSDGSGTRLPEDDDGSNFGSKAEGSSPRETEEYWTEERMEDAATYPMPSPSVAAPSEGRARRPNVVLITIDTLRADALGLYGNPGGHSPNIDALGAGAVVFDNAVTVMGTTVPSHATMFTGLYPKRLGVRWNGDTLDQRFATLAEILSRAGYETAVFVSWGLLLSNGGLDQGFPNADRVEDNPELGLRSGDEVNGVAIPWLASRNDRPFFLWLHYYEPHAPYRLTSYAREQLAGYRGPLAEGGSVQAVYSLGREAPLAPEDVRALRVLYDGEVREADRLVGEVIDSLRRRDLLDETIVLLTADHGQSLGEHGEIGHGFLLTQPVLHVPLLLRHPNVPPRRVPDRVSVVDLAPSLLELIGLPVPSRLDGRSLTPVLSGEPLPARPYFAEVRAVGDRLSRMQRSHRDPQELASSLQIALEQDPGAVAVFEGHLKGVWAHGEFQVYDLVADPKELRSQPIENLDAQGLDGPRPLPAEMRKRATEYHDPSSIGPSIREFNEAVKKELEALGYL